MTRVLSLDLARRTGWAVGSHENGVEAFGVHEFPKVRLEEIGEYVMAARMTFRKMLAQARPGVVVFEAPILVPKRDTAVTLQKIYALPCELAAECWRAELPCRRRDNDRVIAQFLLGKPPRNHDDRKLATKVMARRRGWKVTDDNDADALALLDFELAMLNPHWASKLALRISGGPSAHMSSLGADAFVGSQVFFPPAIEAATAGSSSTSSDGGASASRTERDSSGKTTAIIRPSAGAMSSTSSPSRQMQLGLARASNPSRSSRR